MTKQNVFGTDDYLDRSNLGVEQEILVRRKWQERAQKWEGDNYILRGVLKEVMEWINNWSPDFTDDPEWEETRERVNSVLKNASD